MTKAFELLIGLFMELMMWQENTRPRKTDDPITAHWRKLNRNLGVQVATAALCFTASILLWAAIPDSTNAMLSTVIPLLVLPIKGLLLGTLFCACAATWTLAQILLFDHWPHDFEN